jgi:hypothetical protein
MRNMASIKWAVPLALVVTLLVLLSCLHPPPPERRKAQEIWQKHESVIEAAALGRPFDLNDFYEACGFVEALTGISVPGDASTEIMWAPTKETVKALEPLRVWYKKNKDLLYWDAEKQVVVLKPAEVGE